MWEGYIIIITITWSRWQARITRSNSTLRVSFDLMIRACQLDVIRHFRSSYCYNNIYLSHRKLFTIFLNTKHWKFFKYYSYIFSKFFYSCILLFNFINTFLCTLTLMYININVPETKLLIHLHQCLLIQQVYHLSSVKSRQ